jgi:hypothetical protein
MICTICGYDSYDSGDAGHFCRPTEGYRLTLGKVFINRSPLELLKHLRANIGYNNGYCIHLTESDVKRIRDCIDFHEGK